MLRGAPGCQEVLATGFESVARKAVMPSKVPFLFPLGFFFPFCFCQCLLEGCLLGWTLTLGTRRRRTGDGARQGERRGLNTVLLSPGPCCQLEPRKGPHPGGARTWLRDTGPAMKCPWLGAYIPQERQAQPGFLLFLWSRADQASEEGRASTALWALVYSRKDSACKLQSPSTEKLT